MILRVDLVAWGMAALLALLAGAWRARAARNVAGTTRGATALAGLAILALAGGLLWRLWPAHSWPPATGADALALMALGALLGSLWLDWRRSQLPFDPDQGEVLAHACALAGVALVCTGALLAGWRLPAPAAIAQAQTPLFGLRSLLAALGLGGWLFMTAGSLVAGAGYAARLGRRRREGELAVAASPGNGAEPGEVLAAPAALPRSDEPGQGPPGPEASTSRLPDETAIGEAALRFSFPWLTAALAFGAAWSTVALATPWRGRPAELWLVVTWLVGAAYLQTLSSASLRTARLLVHVLPPIGLAAALLAAWQAPTLFN